MKTSILLLILCLSVGLTTYGQDLVKWSQPINLDEDNIDVRLLEFSNDNSGPLIFEVLKLRTGYAIKAELHDQRGQVINTKTFKFKGGLDEIKGIFKIGDGYYFFVQEFAIKKSMYKLNAYKFNPADFTIPEVPITLADVKSAWVGEWYQFIHEKSNGMTYVLETPPRSQSLSDTLKWRYKGYDSNLTMVWNKEVNIGLQPSRFSKSSFDVDSEGNLILSGDYYSEPVGAFRIKKYPKSEVIICTLLKNEKDVRITRVDLKQEIPKGGGIILSNDQIICYGDYTRDSVTVAYLTAGLYYAVYDVFGRVLQPTQMRDFPASILKEANQGRALIKHETGNEILSYKLAGIQPVQDGGLQFILEQSNMSYFSRSTDAGDFRFTQYGWKYWFGNIMVASLYEDPSKDWFNLLPKSQSSTSISHVSFTRWYSPTGTLNIFYNDDFENLSIKPGEKPKPISILSKGDIVVVRAKISPSGELDKSVIFRSKDSDLYFMPMTTRYYGNTAVFTTASLKYYKTGYFNIDD